MGAVLGAQRDADRGADRHFLVGEVERLRQREEDAATDALGVADIGQLGEEHRELVAREAPDQRRPPLAGLGREPVGDRAQAIGDHAEQHVAGGVAHRVVDGLEAVEIDEIEHRDRSRRQLGEHPLAGPAEIGAVGEAGDGIEHREPLDALQIGVELAEQPIHRLGERGHAFLHLGRDLAFEVAVGGAREAGDGGVDRGGRGGDGALGRGPAHHAADDRRDQRARGALDAQRGMRIGGKRQDERHRTGAHRERDRAALERESFH